MKARILYILLLLFVNAFYMQGQTVKILDVPTAGSLATLIGADKTTVIDLTLTGTINDADFTTIKQMTALKKLNLENVNIENKTIPTYAFQNKVLEKISFPQNLEKIGDFAFARATISEEIILPLTLRVIGRSGFEYATLPSLDVSKCINLEEIGPGAFIQTNMKNNNILNFSQCDKFNRLLLFGTSHGPFSFYTGHVILPNVLKEIPAYSFVSFNGSVDLPSVLETIGSNAFQNAVLLKGLELPSSLKIISYAAFQSVSLPSLDFSQCPNLEELGRDAFRDIKLTENTTLDFSSNTKLTRLISQYGAGPFTNLTCHVVLPKNMTILPNGSFMAFKGSVDLPSVLETIGSNTFQNAVLLKGLELPSSLKIISYAAFQSVSLPSLDFSQCPNLEELGRDAFRDIKLTENTTLDFSSNTKLTRLISQYGASPFTNLTCHVILPINMTVLPNGSFMAFKGSVDLSPTLEKIGVSAFSNASITSIDFPQSLIQIDANAFSGCTLLQEITIKNPTPPVLGTTVFNGVNKETSKLTVPKSSMSLYQNALQWKDFLNIDVMEDIEDPEEPEEPFTPDAFKKGKESNVFVSIPTFYWSQGTDLTGYDYDTKTATGGKSPINKTYKTIDIDEYTWTTENLRLKYGSLDWINHKQEDVDFYVNKYMAGKSVTLEEFDRIFGSWISEDMMSQAYRTYPEAYDTRGGTKIEGWGLPSSEDIWQLYGQAPKISENYYENIKDFLFASACDNTYGWTQDMFNRRNISGLTLMPLGVRESSPAEVKPDRDRKGFGEIMNWVTNQEAKREFLQEWNWDTKTFPTATKGLLAHPRTYYWGQARYRKAKTAEELGYKLYIDETNDKIQMLPHTEISALPELPKGLERGIALRYANREHMKVLNKWSQIQAEAIQIRDNLTISQAGAPILSCEEVMQPDEYEKGEESSVHIWISRIGSNHEGVGFAAYDFDTNTTMADNAGFQKTYKTIGIGEYDYTSENLQAKYRYIGTTDFTWMNWSEENIASLTKGHLPTSTETPLTPDEFRNFYGNWFNFFTSIDSYGKPDLIKFRDKDKNEIPNWRLPELKDILQMVGQAPRLSQDVKNDVLSFLGASSKDTPSGHKANWFDTNKNTSGLTLTPLGSRHPIPGNLSENLYDSFKELSRIRLKDRGENFEFWTSGLKYNNNDFHFMQVRYARAKTDEELGYKLFVDNCSDAVVMLPYNQTTRSKVLERGIVLKGLGQDIVLRNTDTQVANLIELPKGLERGIALRYANRSYMKIFKKWSEIVAEGKSIREQLKNVPDMEDIPMGCDSIPLENIERQAFSIGTIIPLEFEDHEGNILELNVTWVSSNPAVGVIENNNSIRLIGEGITILSVIWEDGLKDDLLEITVYPAGVFIPVTEVTLNKSQASLTIGDSETLIATVLPENAIHKNVIWSSSDESIASIDDQGKVTAVSAGTATITVTSEEGSKTADCLVTIKAAEPEEPGGNEGEEENEDGEYIIYFSYDASGNRISRQEIILSTRTTDIAEQSKMLLDNVSEHTVKIYPNPTEGQLFIEISDLNNVSGDLTILNIRGQVVAKKTVTFAQTNLDISNQPAGTYILKIRINGKVSTWKIIKK